MDDYQPLTVHESIQKGFSVPPLQKCHNCCSPSKYHCPFCLPTMFKPTIRSRVLGHLNIHLMKAIYIGEYTIHRCGLQCRRKRHYHCLYCTATVMKKNDFTAHLPFCRRMQQQRAQKNRLQTEGLIAPPLMPGEDSNNDSDDITIILASDDQSSRGESSSSSSSSRSPSVPKSNGCDTVYKMRTATEPFTAKCHQAVQTNIEKPQDCDEYYFMNLAKMFKRLSPRKKAVVRMKIERLLFEAECE
ncbi:uncharacterized protein LOC143325352 [Chaetodon auriga]|uniref:uncharacterized protein LOC143325352 n=1 Tax=Chaetodon auriga TaxID=39042 RepID=UPI004032B448